MRIAGLVQVLRFARGGMNASLMLTSGSQRCWRCVQQSSRASLGRRAPRTFERNQQLSVLSRRRARRAIHLSFFTIFFFCATDFGLQCVPLHLLLVQSASEQLFLFFAACDTLSDDNSCLAGGGTPYLLSRSDAEPEKLVMTNDDGEALSRLGTQMEKCERRGLIDRDHLNKALDLLELRLVRILQRVKTFEISTAVLKKY